MKKILIVDDEENIRSIYSKFLNAEGYKAITASNAIDANETLKRNNIDLVLLDLKMPGVNGADLYEIIRLFHQNSKVIVTSVFSLSEQKKVASGAHDYHDKSDGLNILILKVKEALNEASDKKFTYC